MIASRLLSARNVRYLRYRVERSLHWGPDISYKEHTELAFWRRELEKIVAWYDGRLKRHWDRPSPPATEKISDYDPVTNAVLTWAHVNWHYYPEHLLIPTNYFANMRLLDVGCGPLPRARVFEQCEPYGLDPLVDLYREAGFPIDHHKDYRFVCAGAEAIPFADGFFDAVISVNAIDHVEDFSAAASEMIRVLKPGGILRLEIHYHAPTICEPWALSDESVARAFHPMKVRKIAQRRCSEVAAGGRDDEVLTVWSN